MATLPYSLPTSLPGDGDGSGPFVPLPGDVAYIESHCEENKALLSSEYKEKPRLEGYLCAFGDVAQPLEQAFYQLLTERGLTTAKGKQLDILGRIVGEPRRDRTDDVYRIYIGIRILVNSSDGTVEDLLSILRAAFGSVSFYIYENDPMSVQVFLADSLGFILPLDFLLYLRLAKDAAVRLDFIWGTTDNSHLLIFGNGAGSVGVHQTLGSTTDVTIGGLMAGVSR